MLEREVRDAVMSTAGTAAGAGAFGVLLTSILPTTIEDLLVGQNKCDAQAQKKYRVLPSGAISGGTSHIHSVVSSLKLAE